MKEYIFPENFLWGGAVSACQIEGGFSENDKGLSTSDIHKYIKGKRQIKIENEHTLKSIKESMNDKQNFYPKRFGIDFYHTYKKDLKLLAELGLKTFRTSIAWSRIFPNGDEDKPNEEALKFYDNLIDEIIKNGMEPNITMTHYEIPLGLVLKYKGFTNRELMNHFVKYAKVILDRFNKKVKYWIVFNQINLIQNCNFNSLGIPIDYYDNFEEAQYQGVHHQFLASALIKEYAKKINNSLQIGTMVCDNTSYPNTCNPEDVILAMKRNRMQYYFTDVQLRGEYPTYALNYFKEYNINLKLDKKDLKIIKNNTMDWLGISYYNSINVSADKNGMNPIDTTINPYLDGNEWGWTIDPNGIYNSLSQYWDRYDKPLMILENGFGFDDVFENETVIDDYRINYLKEHVKKIWEAINDGANVLGYYPWGPIDLVSSGTAEMSKRYGFIYVDQDDEGNGTKKRYKKASFDWYKNIIIQNGIK